MKQLIYNTALYLRLSRDDELSGGSGSISTRRTMLRQYAQEHGLNVVDEYIDDGWSGTNFDRPAFQRQVRCAIIRINFPLQPMVAAISSHDRQTFSAFCAILSASRREKGAS